MSCLENSSYVVAVHSTFKLSETPLICCTDIKWSGLILFFGGIFPFDLSITEPINQMG
jgi:hypothetical protein